MDLIATPA